MPDEIRKAKRINCIALAVVFLLAALILGGFLRYTHSHTFTRKLWDEKPDRRTRIVDSLLAEYNLVGRTEEEIVALLGENDNESGYFSAPDRFVYCLGPERDVISIDSEWLILDFRDGAVADYFITTD